MKVAQAKLKEIGPDDMNMEEYKVPRFFKSAEPHMLVPEAKLTVL